MQKKVRLSIWINSSNKLRIVGELFYQNKCIILEFFVIVLAYKLSDNRFIIILNKAQGPDNESLLRQEKITMKITVIQAYLFPYIGYFQLLKAVDV